MQINELKCSFQPASTVTHDVGSYAYVHAGHSTARVRTMSASDAQPTLGSDGRHGTQRKEHSSDFNRVNFPRSCVNAVTSQASISSERTPVRFRTPAGIERTIVE